MNFWTQCPEVENKNDKIAGMGYLRYGSADIRFPKAGFSAIIFIDNPLVAEGYYGEQPKETDNIQSSETEKEGIGVDVSGNRQSL